MRAPRFFRTTVTPKVLTQNPACVVCEEFLDEDRMIIIDRDQDKAMHLRVCSKTYIHQAINEMPAKFSNTDISLRFGIGLRTLLRIKANGS